MMTHELGMIDPGEVMAEMDRLLSREAEDEQVKGEEEEERKWELERVEEIKGL